MLVNLKVIGGLISVNVNQASFMLFKKWLGKSIMRKKKNIPKGTMNCFVLTE